MKEEDIVRIRMKSKFRKKREMKKSVKIQFWIMEP